MSRFYTCPRSISLLLFRSFLASVCPAWAQEPPAKSTLKPEITAQEAQTLEDGLKSNPDNLAVREKLITYYFMAALTSRAAELEEKRERHVFWLIEHHPESDLAGSPEAGVEPVGYLGSTEGYQHGKQLWLAQVESHPDSPQVIHNAAQFVSLWDRILGRQLLEKSLQLNPSDNTAASLLAQSYMQERLDAESPEQKAALAAKALSVQERALDSSAGNDRFNELGHVADEAYEAGDFAKAEQYASEVLQLAPQFKNDWNYGNALHMGNIVLGRVALQRGDVSGAKQYLLAAGATPGSPQLDSFGPNMTLAKELLEKGERDTVLAYLQSCSKFWEMGDGQLQAWAATVKGGGIPDFGANLVY
jgi:tetratricopeptide (TPR) repeat protein